MPTVAIMGTAIKHPVPLTLSGPERQMPVYQKLQKTT